MSKRTVYTVCVDNYFPELCNITLPLIDQYAKRIGAKFEIIDNRKFPDFPPTYEKLQIHERGVDSEWNLLIDADMLISPKLQDLIQGADQFSIAMFMQYDASLLFKADQYFVRDGRKLGIATNLVLSHNATHDLWTPLEITPHEARESTKRWHIVDEYCVSRNVARFGLKVAGLDIGWNESEHAPHKLDPTRIYQSKALHLDVSTNSKEVVLEVAKRHAKLWS